MLKSADMYKELEICEKARENAPDEVSKALLKLGILQVKLLHSVRRNQVRQMEHEGIKFEGRDREQVAEKE